MVDAQRIPGFDTPGPVEPGKATPGSRVPDEGAIGERHTQATGVAIDATGTTTVGTPSGYGGEIRAVRVNADAADFDFNIEADGTDIFTAEQSPSGTNEETFVPNQELSEFEGDAPDLVIDVSSASATGGATATVTVDTAIEEQ